MDKGAFEHETSREKTFQVKRLLKNLVVGIGLLALFMHTANAQWVNFLGGIGGGGTQGNAGAVTCIATSGGNLLIGDIGTWSPPPVGTFGSGEYAGCGVFLSPPIDGVTEISWTPKNSTTPYWWSLVLNKPITSFAVNGSNVFAGTINGVLLSKDSGITWTSVSSGLSNSDVSCLALSGNNVFAGTWIGTYPNGGYSSGVCLSTNNDTGWTMVGSGLPNNETVTSLAVSESNIFAGVSNGSYGSGVFLSSNNGTSWTAVNNGFTSGTNENVKALAVSGNNIFAGTAGDGVFLSTNSGALWKQVNNGLTNFGVNCLTVSGNAIFAGTDSGVYASTNNGASWNGVDSGLSPANSAITALGVWRGLLIAGGGSQLVNGLVWYRPLSEMMTAVKDKPRQGALNPCTNGLRINITKNGIAVLLPATLNNGAVTVGLFTIAGRKIYSATHLARNGTLNIPVSGLSIGTYLMSIRGGNITLSSPFVVTK